jgi:hypothetical protein
MERRDPALSSAPNPSMSKSTTGCSAQTAVIPGTRFFEVDDRRGHAISIPFFKKPFRDLKVGGFKSLCEYETMTKRHIGIRQRRRLRSGAGRAKGRYPRLRADTLKPKPDELEDDERPPEPTSRDQGVALENDRACQARLAAAGGRHIGRANRHRQ